MPFDATPVEPARTPNPDVEFIDRLIEALGPDGERWIKGNFTGGRYGHSHCIVGLIELMASAEGRYIAPTLAMITRGLPQENVYNPRQELIRFNDLPSTRFANMLSVLHKAREVALKAQLSLL